MPLLVTVDMFSGMENPSFVIGDDESRNILSGLEANRSRLAELPRPSVLGYRGFRVTHIAEQDRPAPELFQAGGAEATFQVYDHPEIEKQLIELSGQALRDDDLQSLLYAEFERTSGIGWAETLAKTQVKCPPCNAADAPAYNPGFWNTPARQPYNNCYNYANNQATNTFAQPGRATGRPGDRSPRCPATASSLRPRATGSSRLQASPAISSPARAGMSPW